MCVCQVYLHQCKPLTACKQLYFLGKLSNSKLPVLYYKKQGVYNYILDIQIYARVCTLVKKGYLH